MNCLCDPPRPCTTKVSQKQNENNGKSFFTCATNSCNFFAWQGSYIPASIGGARRNKRGPGSSSSKMHGSPAKVNGKHQVRVLIHEITGYPPVEIKISIQTPSSPVINDLFARMPPEKCSYNHGLKMWILSFSLYDKIVAEFHTPPFSSFHLDELPNFLTNGLSKFLRRLPKVAVGSDSSLQVDPALLAVMMPFQVESLRFVINHGGRALLADDMGIN